MATILSVETEEILDEIQSVEADLNDKTTPKSRVERDEMVTYLRELRVKLAYAP